MAKARMLDQDVAGSERFWELSAEARVAYLLGIPFADRDGYLPAKPRKLMGLYLGMSGCTLDQVQHIIDEIVESGMWEVGPNESVRIRRFHEYQPGILPGSTRYERERPSKYDFSHTSHTLLTNLSPDSHTLLTEVKLREEKGREEMGSSSDTPNRLGGFSRGDKETRHQQVRPPLEERTQRLMDCWRGAYRQRNVEAPDQTPMLPPVATFFEAAQMARDLGETLDYFPTNELLISEIRRVIRCYLEMGYTVTFKGTTKCIGQTFEKCSTPEPVIWKGAKSGTIQA